MIDAVSAPKSKPALPVVLAAVFGRPGIVLIRRDQDPFRGLWGLPGGKVHRGEHLDAAVEREVAEETGLRARFVELRGVVTEKLIRAGQPDMHYLMLVCRLATRGTALRPSPEGEVRWFDPPELAGMRAQMIPSDRQMLERLVLARPDRTYFRCLVRERAGRYAVNVFR
jgi:ADP-ribose pyrophosphatase YjhB (NUDIX family)